MPKQLPLDAGARYAITTLTRYVVVALGIVVGFNAIGFQLVERPVAGGRLDGGPRSGLQEIFANSISGLILLFEQPIRVGDIVTVDGTTESSAASRPATTVTNWDRQDFIVPNKEFITGRLLNWTRSDHVNRIVINVGIAYGSDTELARRLIEQVLREHPEVLDDPASIVTFEGLARARSPLRALLPGETRQPLAHDPRLHTGIDQAFRKAGIEIAFPRRHPYPLHGRASPQGPDMPRSPGSDYGSLAAADA